MENNYTKYLVHGLLWCVYVIIFFSFTSQRLDTFHALAVALLVAGTHASVFYINYSILLDAFYFKGRTFLYLLSVLITIMAAVGINYVAFELIDSNSLYNRVFTPPAFSNAEFSPPPSFRLFRLIPLMILSVILVLVSFILRGTELSKIQEKELESLRTANYESELKFLKSQINPHFLFNSLNNIYSLSVAGSKKTPVMLVKLSSILRYLIYECNVEKVSIEKEIEYIQNYIDLQKLKDDQIINISFKYETSNLEISPMLLMPFIENAFKHSKIEDIENGWINICITFPEHNMLRFQIENSLPKVIAKKDNTGGVGIENVKKRLELLYPKHHDITFEKDESSFKVDLKMELT